MKCPLKVQLHICHGCKISGCCHTSPNSDLYEDETKDAYDMFDLLAHSIIPHNVRKRKINKTKKDSSTYRDAYCGKKRIPSPAKIHVPFSSIFIPNGKMCSETTHKHDFKPNKRKTTKQDKIITHRDNLTCLKAKFEDKSETKSAYIPKKVSMPRKSEAAQRKYNKENIQIPEGNMESSTTYKSTYKRPKNFQKPEIHKPNIARKSPPPFNHTSQYQCDFKKPRRVKRENFKKTSVYHPPILHMEDKTTYKSDFYYKNPSGKQSTKEPEHRVCKTIDKKFHCPCLEVTLKGCFNRNQHIKDFSCKIGEGDNALISKRIETDTRKDCQHYKAFNPDTDKIRCNRLKCTCECASEKR